MTQTHHCGFDFLANQSTATCHGCGTTMTNPYYQANLNLRQCENCGTKTTIYAMDIQPNGWAGWYCQEHIPTGFTWRETI